MNNLEKLISKFKQSKSTLERMGILGQIIKEIQEITKQESKKV